MPSSKVFLDCQEIQRVSPRHAVLATVTESYLTRWGYPQLETFLYFSMQSTHYKLIEEACLYVSIRLTTDF